MGFTYSPISKDDSTISDKVLYWNETMVFNEYLSNDFEKIIHAIFYRNIIHIGFLIEKDISIILTNIFGLNIGNNFIKEIQLFLT